ncbi:MAG: GTP-binding protein, partial [Paludibacteraceae bacterium]|nr:GTP-binding protein [Paludibacteraceae bacterium]
MKVYQTNEIKNISIVGSSGSGKTTLTEAMLFESGVIKRRGSVASKNTVSDYFPVEQDYGYSIFPTVFYAEWMNRKLNMIDCPGADDFVGGLITSLSVTDTALMLINAQHGVEVGTQNQYRQIAQLRKPCMFVVNQLDHDKADFEKSVDDLRQHFGKKVVLIQYPIQTGANFNAVIDVLLMKMYTWKPEGGEPAISEIPANEMERASELHNILVEAAAENEEGLMEKYFSDGNLTEEEMRMGIRFGLLHRDVFPVFCLSAGKDMGVRRLMEFLGNIVPYVRDSPAPITTKGQEVPPLKENNTSIYVFKTSIEPHIGEVSFFKVMSGSVKEGDDLYNATRQSKERLTQLYNVCGSIRTKVEELVAGDIGATVKLKNTRTSNTLNGKNADGQFSFIKYPEWKFRRAISAVNQAEEEKLSEVLTRMHEEDLTWIIEYSKELKQLIVHGQGEFHLKTLKWRIE